MENLASRQGKGREKLLGGRSSRDRGSRKFEDGNYGGLHTPRIEDTSGEKNEPGIGKG